MEVKDVKVDEGCWFDDILVIVVVVVFLAMANGCTLFACFLKSLVQVEGSGNGNETTPHT